MLKRKWTVYIIHHSHTDIGYTDLQENIIYKQIDYIKDAVKIAKEGHKAGTVEKFFKWNCETYYCVEKFLEDASDEEKQDFYSMVRSNNIGISASYLNFTDLVDKRALDIKTKEMISHFKRQGIDIKTAMNADINGISLGAFEVFLENGIEFLYTNIHTHHGMYPLYQNQKPYFWEGENGKKLLVFSGEHYHLGNWLGLIESNIDSLKANIVKYLTSVEENGYDYDFIPVSVSGESSDNAPPNTDIIKIISAFNEAFGNDIYLEMVTLQEFYEKIENKVRNAPVYKGDLNDWWANGIASTPYAVKHYKEAQRMYRLCNRLDPEGLASDKALLRQSEENLLLYSEHTWGFSTSISNPYNTMVLNLDIRKTSYASKAHEACAKNLNLIRRSKGDINKYYSAIGKVKAINVSDQDSDKLVQFYIEGWRYSGVNVICNKTGKEMVTQISPYHRGVLISFVDYFRANEEKVYRYEKADAPVEEINRRVAYIGSELVRDIVNEYDPVNYKLPYQIENEFFKISYEIGKGVTSFFNKVDNVEMLKNGDARFFTPIYEKTEVRTDSYTERRLLGRNVRGLHAKKYIAELTDVKVLEIGKVFSTIELIYSLEGTFYTSVVIRLYNTLPKIDFRMKIAKTLSMDIESIYLPLALNLPDYILYIDKSDEIMRPGIDQIPGTCMEYYLTNNGLVYESKENTILIHLKDAPLIYMGELKHHPILLCDNKIEYNKRNVYSWIMHNTWETNFKINLAGITEFCYTLDILKTTNAEQSFQRMKDECDGVVTFMIDD